MCWSVLFLKFICFREKEFSQNVTNRDKGNQNIYTFTYEMMCPKCVHVYATCACTYYHIPLKKWMNKVKWRLKSCLTLSKLWTGMPGSSGSLDMPGKKIQWRNTGLDSEQWIDTFILVFSYSRLSLDHKMEQTTGLFNKENEFHTYCIK